MRPTREEYSLSILHWRCGSQYPEAVLSRQELSFAFQYSIGDALSHSWVKYDESKYNFQYSIGDAYLILISTLAYFEYFQYSIGDALIAPLPDLLLRGVLSILHWRCGIHSCEVQRHA